MLGNDFARQTVILKIKLQEQGCSSLHCCEDQSLNKCYCTHCRWESPCHVHTKQYCFTLLFSHLHSPAFSAFLSPLPLHLTCCAELRDQLGATECSHRLSDHCADLIRCVSHLRGAQPPFQLVVFYRLVLSSTEPVADSFLCNCWTLLAYVIRNTERSHDLCPVEQHVDRFILC